MSMMEETKTKLESTGDSSEVDNGNCSSSCSGGGDTKKTCVDCGTSRTPLWRGGPAGPKSLCNACGIKSRKRRQAALETRQKEDDKTKNKTNNNLSVKITKGDQGNLKNKIKNSNSNNNKGNVKGVSRFLDLGFKVPSMKRSVVEKKRLWKKLGEEERAAVLLMTLSCG